MRILGAVVKAFGVAVVVVIGAALLVVAVPTLRAQIRHDPLVDIRTTVLGVSEIGVRMRDVTADDVTREKLPAAAGAMITEVRPGGPAAAAGLAVGDVVLSFDSEKVRSSRHLSRLIEETPEGREVPLEVMRNGSRMSLRVKPSSPQPFGDFMAFNRLHERFPADRFQFRDLGTYSYFVRPARLGLHAQDLTGQLGDYFGASSGALVTGVDENSPARTAGLKAGDVITAINGQSVRDSADIQRRLSGIEGKATFTIVRDRKEMTLDVTISRDPITDRRGVVK